MMPPKKPYPTLTGTHKFKPTQLSVIDHLIFELGVTAGKWRETKAERYITRYLRIYKQLRALKWEGALDVDALLPARYMPEDYLQRFNISVETSSDK